MAEHFFITVFSIVMVLAPVILEAYANVLNPTPKMEDRNEERRFSRTICKTREMYSVIKR